MCYENARKKKKRPFKNTRDARNGTPREAPKEGGVRGQKKANNPVREEKNVDEQ